MEETADRTGMGRALQASIDKMLEDKERMEIDRVESRRREIVAAEIGNPVEQPLTQEEAADIRNSIAEEKRRQHELAQKLHEQAQRRVEVSLDQVPVEELVVETKPLKPQSKIGTKEFGEALYNLLANGKEIWRKSNTLAAKLEVDPIEMDKFLRAQPVIASRRGQEEGVFLYALVQRLEPEKKPDEEKKPTRQLVGEEDYYTLASMNDCLMVLETALRKHAVKIAERNPEAFTQLVSAKEKLEAGLYLFAGKIKADMNKLPKV